MVVPVHFAIDSLQYVNTYLSDLFAYFLQKVSPPQIQIKYKAVCLEFCDQFIIFIPDIVWNVNPITEPNLGVVQHTRANQIVTVQINNLAFFTTLPTYINAEYSYVTTVIIIRCVYAV